MEEQCEIEQRLPKSLVFEVVRNFLKELDLCPLQIDGASDNQTTIHTVHFEDFLLVKQMSHTFADQDQDS